MKFYLKSGQLLLLSGNSDEIRNSVRKTLNQFKNLPFVSAIHKKQYKQGRDFYDRLFISNIVLLTQISCSILSQTPYIGT